MPPNAFTAVGFWPTRGIPRKRIRPCRGLAANFSSPRRYVSREPREFGERRSRDHCEAQIEIAKGFCSSLRRPAYGIQLGRQHLALGSKMHCVCLLLRVRVPCFVVLKGNQKENRSGGGSLLKHQPQWKSIAGSTIGASSTKTFLYATYSDS